MPAPLPPSTATRSPNHSSRSNGSVRPSSSSCSTIDAPACRCGRRRGACRCAARGPSAGRSLRSTNWRSRLSAAFSLGANVVGDAWPAGASRRRGPRAACARRRTATGPCRACRGGPGGPRRSRRSRRRASTRRSASTVTIFVAVAASSSRSWLTYSTVLRVACSSPSSQRLAGDVEEVVGLVEQQDVVVAAQQHLEGDALLLAAGERAQRPRRRPRRGRGRRRGWCTRPSAPRRRSRRASPQSASGVGVAHRVVVGAALGGGEPACGAPQRRRGERHEQLARRSAARRATRRRCRRAGASRRGGRRSQIVPDRRRRARRRSSAQQRRLADAVGADERGPLAVADGEADVAQQLDAAGKSPAEMADLDRAHGRATLRSRGGSVVADFGAAALRLRRARRAAGGRAPRRRRRRRRARP